MSDNQSDNSIEWVPWEDYKVNKSRVEDSFWGDSYKVNDITEMRITVRKPGGSMIVVDVDNEPSYSFYLSTEQTNSFLVQLLNKKS
jgi:hypothetical protein